MNKKDLEEIIRELKDRRPPFEATVGEKREWALAVRAFGDRLARARPGFDLEDFYEQVGYKEKGVMP